MSIGNCQKKPNSFPYSQKPILLNKSEAFVLLTDGRLTFKHKVGLRAKKLSEKWRMGEDHVYRKLPEKA